VEPPEWNIRRGGGRRLGGVSRIAEYSLIYNILCALELGVYFYQTLPKLKLTIGMRFGTDLWLLINFCYPWGV